MSKGTDFELQVASLLRSSTGYKNVREQQHICGKNVDIVFQKQWNPHKFRTIAIECKDWKSGINRDVIRETYFDYKPLFDNKRIDELWIVTPKPVSATVQEHADHFDGLEIIHLGELEKDIIDFSLYATFLRDRFQNDTLSQYYIPSRVLNSTSTLHSRISNWLASASSRPIAIWAGYGMGKTSYASYLASELASHYLTDSSKRIPILIPLGDYYTSPRIDGLFASTLTREHGVHGYNYNTFWNLHESGRFVIILDGFDEMKHAMTTSEFSAITKEIRRLILPNSKVLLLGRPDAIVTGEEHTALMRGRRQVSTLEISDNISAEFDELRLDFFSRDEYLDFLKRYISCFYTRKDRSTYIRSRLKQVGQIGVEDLIKRPVQARMLAQILLNPSNSIEKVSRYDLYSTFIEDCLSREEEKPERRKLSRTIRKDFMQDLSWWLWAIKRTRTFTVADISPSIMKRYVLPERDAIGQLRELLVGSVVEEHSIGTLVSEKDAGTFYFPHLSFTEFLVAEYVIERELSETEIGILAQSFDGEVGSFISGYRLKDGMHKLYSDLNQYRGPLSWSFIEFLSNSHTLEKIVKALVSKPIANVWQFCVEFLVVFRHCSTSTERQSKEAIEKIVGRAADLIGLDDYRTTVISLQILMKTMFLNDKYIHQISKLILTSIFRALNMDKLAAMSRYRYRIISETENLCATMLATVYHTGNTFKFDAISFYNLLLKEDNSISDQTIVGHLEVEVKIDDVRKTLRSKHDRDRFDKWITTASMGSVFNELMTYREVGASRSTAR
ncbi:hypothetical protein SSBR45G_01100 [Bradyrhizobium sp. SSBR45G]|uniref:restriction endonuclease n=1 Tax=unclassified Bradyrhizobium TaxID=2631580 RepID=UPI00234293B7|nr:MULTISPECIES: restriction endonuclease [unclassified Bradyrhizobium]GLH75202.1 hypothetical protein SSBR45G_01100 [Bradyrhizobium sp. SSBR45G]GLH83011.1 hypothetical protein SSBR45R_04710 [Bradyrhizobium sp. SSBR45R]